MKKREIIKTKENGTFPRCPYCGGWVKIQKNGSLARTCCKPECKQLISLASSNEKRKWPEAKRVEHSQLIKNLYTISPEYRLTHRRAIIKLAGTVEWKQKQQAGYLAWHRKRQEMGLEKPRKMLTM